MLRFRFRRPLAPWFFLMLALALGTAMASGCKGSEPSANGGTRKKEVPWPKKPVDGSPVVFEFIEMTGEGDDLAANVRLFNFSDKKVKRVSTTLHYLDADGNELKDFPFGIMLSVDSEDYGEIEVGVFVPEETRRIEVEVHRVIFADDSEWIRPGEATQ